MDSQDALIKNALLVTLAVITLIYLFALGRSLRDRAREGASLKSEPKLTVISFFANFLDTLGIGSYATTTSAVRAMRLVPDERIPGSLNVGYVLPTVAQTFIYTQIVPVDARTLVFMILAAVAGAWLGAGVVSGLPRRQIQLGMGMALLGAAVIMIVRQTGAAPQAAETAAIGLTGTKLMLGIAGNFVLGALMTLGIGLYAPCLILISLLGMNERSAFPIMMGSCAFLMPLASIRFLKAKSYDPRAILGMMLPGIPAVLIAAYIVKSLNLTAVKWLVVVVVLYTAISMIMAARREKKSAAIVSDAIAAEAGA
jgi:uncharacterized membrane protein YfcA